MSKKRLEDFTVKELELASDNAISILDDVIKVIVILLLGQFLGPSLTVVLFVLGILIFGLAVLALFLKQKKEKGR